MDKLLEYENLLFKKSFCSKKENLEKIFHKDFFEFGKSGRIFSRDGTINYLLNSEDRNIQILDFAVNQIDEKTFIVHYKSKHDGKQMVLRTSIWIYENKEFKLYFHQGTITN